MKLNQLIESPCRMDDILTNSEIPFSEFDLKNAEISYDLKDEYEIFVYCHKNHTNLKIFVLKDKSDLSTIISCIVLENIEIELGKFWLLHRSFTNPNFRSKGFTKRIYYHLVYLKKFHVVSDVKLAPATWHIWEELIHNFSSFAKILKHDDDKIVVDDYNGENLYQFNNNNCRFVLMTYSNLSNIKEAIVAHNFNINKE